MTVDLLMIYLAFDWLPRELVNLCKYFIHISKNEPFSSYRVLYYSTCTVSDGYDLALPLPPKLSLPPPPPLSPHQ